MTEDRLEKIQSKIRKLKAMAKMVGPEADNAKRIIDNLVKKYELEGISADEVLDTRKTYRLRAHRLKKYALKLAAFCRVPIHTYRGEPDYVGLELNSMEYRMYYELYDEIKHIFNSKITELKKKQRELGESNSWMNGALRSFMEGYMKANFPFDSMICLQCGEGTLKAISEGRWICPACKATFRSSKWQGYYHNQNEFSQGLATNTKKLSMQKIRIGHNG